MVPSFSQYFRKRIRQSIICPPTALTCDDRNGGCQHICVNLLTTADSSSSIASGPSSSPTNFRCACNTGYSLALDGLHCVRSPECGHVRVDVVFVLDTSNSVSHQSYKNALGVVVEFVRFIQRVSLVCHRRISS